MFGFSFAKILVLAIVIIAAWRFFKWIERRADTAIGKPAQRPAQAREQAPAAEEKTGDVELEQDPVTGVWRPKR